MFRTNHKHLQPPLVSTVQDLPPAQRRLLEESWAGIFYREFFCRLDEAPFKVLYADVPSRPNVPVNRLVALEVLKAGFGWSDAELYEAYLFNVQVRYALGLQDLGTDSFDVRTLYYFRARLSDHMQATGENLIETAFTQVTDEQLAAFALKTGRLRMDATFVASNIRQRSRLQLLVELLQRVHRMLREPDRQPYTADFAPYVQGSAGQVLYHLRGQDIAPHLEHVGLFMARLVAELAAVYGQDPTYRLLTRVFPEHFVCEPDRLRLKTGQELNAKTLQSPDDPEATYRTKGGERHVGYVSNITETCDPENKLQLIVAVQTAPNVTDDATLLAAALPGLKERIGVQELTTDGGYVGEATRQAMAAQQVQHVLTSRRGARPECGTLAGFTLSRGTDGTPTTLTCPAQQVVPLTSKHPERYVAHFAGALCGSCPPGAGCPARPLTRLPVRALYLRGRDLAVAEQQRAFLLQDKAGTPNLRGAIEGTISALKRPFAAGQLPVRGLSRVAVLLLAAAALANVRRIHRYVRAQATPKPSAGTAATAVPPLSFVVSLVRHLWRLIAVSITAQPLRYSHN